MNTEAEDIASRLRIVEALERWNAVTKGVNAVSNDTDYERAEKVFGPDMRAAEKLAAVLNPETIFRKSEDRPTRIVDLQRRYDIAITRLPTLFRQEQWEAIDRVTFDHEPGSRWHIHGRGDSTTEAVSDLLAQLAEEIAKG